MEGHKHILTVQSPLGREEQSLPLQFPTLCLQEWEPNELREPNTLRQGGTCSELRNHTTFTATAKVLGKSEAQREAQEAAKEQRRKELKKDRWRKEALSILACSGPAGAVLCSHLIQLQPWLGEQSITLRRHGRLKSLEGQKPDAELQVTCAEGGRRGSAQAAVMA